MGLSMDPHKVADVQTSMAVLKSMGVRWHCAGVLLYVVQIQRFVVIVISFQ